MLKETSFRDILEETSLKERNQPPLNDVHERKIFVKPKRRDGDTVHRREVEEGDQVL
jgi:hypothetical protein